MTMRINWGPVRAQLLERCGGYCEVSAQPLDPDTFDVHHRRLKGMGGTSRADVHDLDNLLALAPFVHNLSPDSVHGAPAWSRPRGYLLSKNVNHPGSHPVLLQGERWVLLTKSGRYAPLPAGVTPGRV